MKKRREGVWKGMEWEGARGSESRNYVIIISKKRKTANERERNRDRTLRWHSIKALKHHISAI